MKTYGAMLRVRPCWKIAATAIFCSLFFVARVDADRTESVSDQSIKETATVLPIGMSTALTGPSAELGIAMRHGVLAAFREANEGELLRGRKLELIALDDGYEPARTAPNMHRLTQEMQVLAVVGNVGTPTAITAIPIAEKTGTPFFGAFTGASALRKAGTPDVVINYRASYAEETAAMVDALIANGIRPEEIAFFTQNDSYGDDGFFGGLAAIRNHQAVKISSVAHGRYRRNTSHVEDGLADLLLHQPLPKAVIMVGTYGPCSKLVRLARENNFHPQFLAVSFVGSQSLKRSLGEQANGIIATQVVPHFNSELLLVRQYRAAMRAHSPDVPFSFVSLEGYIVGRIMVQAIDSIEGDITRSRITEALEALGSFDLGLGTPLTLGPDDHQASGRVWPVMIGADGCHPVSWEGVDHE
ncbi:ABC transporter substrate-binding protein [Rhodopirellula sp. JC737]|nr:ABC transporter substrate-binding protein [Rhodopirellula sp. JC737]